MYAVLFDIDGTLLLTGGAGQAAFAETFLEDFQLDEWPPNIPFAGRSDRAIAEEIMVRSGISFTQENWNRFTEGYIRRLSRTLADNQGDILPGVCELLDVLRSRNHVALGLLTGNLSLGAQAKLAHYGLDDRFAFGGFGDHRSNRNDIAADALLEARNYAATFNGNSELHGVMVIGDTLADVECAKSINAFAVAVATGSTTMDELDATQPHLLLKDLTDSRHLLQVVEAAAVPSV